MKKIKITSMDDVDKALRLLSDCTRRLEKADAALKSQVDDLKAKADVAAADDRSQVQALTDALEAYATAHRDELFAAGKSVKRMMGSFGFKATPAKLVMADGYSTDDLVELTLPDGQPVAVRLNGVRSAVSGIYKEGALTALRVTCHLTGTAAQLPEGWDWSEETVEALEAVTAAWAADCIGQSVAMMQSLGADPLELCRRLGARTPWRWEELRAQWDAVFPQLDVRTETSAKMTR